MFQIVDKKQSKIDEDLYYYEIWDKDNDVITLGIGKTTIDKCFLKNNSGARSAYTKKIKFYGIKPVEMKNFDVEPIYTVDDIASLNKEIMLTSQKGGNLYTMLENVRKKCLKFINKKERDKLFKGGGLAFEL